MNVPTHAAAGGGPLLPARARRLLAAASILTMSAAAVAVSVPLLGLRAADCGPFGCDLVQTAGKAGAGVGVALSASIGMISALVHRRAAAAAMAALIVFPALVMTGLVIEDWREARAGTSEAQAVVRTARAHVASVTGQAATDLKGIIVNGRGAWISVRVTAPDRTDLFVLLRRDDGVWAPRAAAPGFTREELVAIGAPTDLLRVS